MNYQAVQISQDDPLLLFLETNIMAADQFEYPRIVDYAISRMAGDAFGASTVLPLLCLHKLGSDNPIQAVEARFEIWKAHVIVAREALNMINISEEVMCAIDQLLMAIEKLKDAYLSLAKCYEMSSKTRTEIYEKLDTAYLQISENLKNFDNISGIRLSFFTRGTLKSTTHKRSMDWIRSELRD